MSDVWPSVAELARDRWIVGNFAMIFRFNFVLLVSLPKTRWAVQAGYITGKLRRKENMEI